MVGALPGTLRPPFLTRSNIESIEIDAILLLKVFGDVSSCEHPAGSAGAGLS
jgi:hypothetical protein